MIRNSFRLLMALGFMAGAALFIDAQSTGQPDLSEYRTAETATTTTVTKSAAPGVGLTSYLGASVARDPEGLLKVEDVQPDSPADKAGLKKGDVITRLGDRAVSSLLAFRELLQTYNPGDQLKLDVARGDKGVELTATLGATSRPMNKADAAAAGGKGGGKGGKGGPVVLPLWQKPAIRLAVVGIEFSDIKHNDKISVGQWEEALFSDGVYRHKKNATGQPVEGSLNDYFLEQSFGKFHVSGRVFDWVDVGKKRGDYSQGLGTNNKTAVLVDALDKIAARGGKDALKEVDGFLFLYAGERVKTNPGAVYYPHVGMVTYKGTSYRYLFSSEGGPRMAAVNDFTKLVGQIVGLPDLAAKPEDRASRGLGVWCALSNPITDGRPQHLSAWAKEKMGWIHPAIIDPTMKQRLILGPIEDSSKECFKILVRPNGSEYYLLENRRKKGSDADLPAEGLLIWRVVNDRPLLCEAHGVDGPSGPLVHLGGVPYPSEANNAFTPDTTPSSRSPLGGGLPVHITEIRKLPDGRIAFSIGHEYR